MFKKKNLLGWCLCWMSSSWLLWSPLYACLPKLGPPCCAQPLLPPIRNIFNLAGLWKKRRDWWDWLCNCASHTTVIFQESLFRSRVVFFLSSLICPPDVLRSHDASLCTLEEECSVFTFLLSSGLTPKVSPPPPPHPPKKSNYWLHVVRTAWSSSTD